LQVRLRAGGLAKLIHHIEGILVGVKIEGLKPRSSSCFKVVYAGIYRGFDGREKVFGKNPCSIHGLETVAKRGNHKLNALFHCIYTPIIKITVPAILIVAIAAKRHEKLLVFFCECGSYGHGDLHAGSRLGGDGGFFRFGEKPEDDGRQQLHHENQ